MKEVKTIVKAANVTAVDFGRMEDLNKYVLELGPDVKIPGKVFGGAAVGTTGSDFSFQSLRTRYRDGFPAYSCHS